MTRDCAGSSALMIGWDRQMQQICQKQRTEQRQRQRQQGAAAAQDESSAFSPHFLTVFCVVFLPPASSVNRWQAPRGSSCSSSAPAAFPATRMKDAPPTKNEDTAGTRCCHRAHPANLQHFCSSRCSSKLERLSSLQRGARATAGRCVLT